MRLALADNLANNLGKEHKPLILRVVFSLDDEEKVEADLSLDRAGLWGVSHERLQKTTVLDPACGSGSFLVGMLAIYDDLMERAGSFVDGVGQDPFLRRKKIIAENLYGVDVMEWACHVATQARLSLIIDTEFDPYELSIRTEPLLPNFSFKIRPGESLVQEVGGIDFGNLKMKGILSPEVKEQDHPAQTGKA